MDDRYPEPVAENLVAPLFLVNARWQTATPLERMKEGRGHVLGQTPSLLRFEGSLTCFSLYIPKQNLISWDGM